MSYSADNVHKETCYTTKRNHSESELHHKRFATTLNDALIFGYAVVILELLLVNRLSPSDHLESYFVDILHT